MGGKARGGAIGSPSDPTTSDARPFQLDTSFSPTQDCACWYDLNGLGTLDSAQQLTVVECTSEPEGPTQACAALIEAAAEAVAAPRQARMGISLRPCLLAFVVVPARAAPAVDGVAILREAWRRHLAERPPGELRPVLLVQPLAPRHVLDLRGGAAQQAAFALRDALAPVPAGAPGPRTSAPPALVGHCRDLGASHIVLRRLGGGRALCAGTRRDGLEIAPRCLEYATPAEALLAACGAAASDKVFVYLRGRCTPGDVEAWVSAAAAVGPSAALLSFEEGREVW